MPLVTSAVVHGEKSLDGDRIVCDIKFFDEDGAEVELGVEVVLTGYTIGTAGALQTTDTLLEALGKLEARLVALETPGSP